MWIIEYFSKFYIFILKKWYESECNIYSYEYEYKFAEVYDHDHLLHFCLGSAFVREVVKKVLFGLSL